MDTSELYFRRSLRAEGYRDDELKRLLRRGQLKPVRRGAYVTGELPAFREERHLLQVRAAIGPLARDAVVSHASAAVLLRLPVWGVSLERVHVTRARRNGGRRDTAIHVHTAPLHDGEITTIDGVAITSPARTLVDLARCVPFEQAVTVLDAALFRRVITGDALDAALVRATGWPGVPGARHAVGFAEPLTESVGESRSRVAIARCGLPAPVPQWSVHTSGGRLLGRADFGWPDLRTVGEFDGRTKYGRLLRPGTTAADAVHAEKLREDALRAEGLAVVRWTWQDLNDGFHNTAAKLRDRFTP